MMKKINVSVPSGVTQETVMEALRAFQLAGQASANEINRDEIKIVDSKYDDVEDEVSEDETEFSVRKVIDHRIDEKTGEFWFTLKTDQGNVFESRDSDCNCETSIREYFTRKQIGVKTFYAICRVSTTRQASRTNRKYREPLNIPSNASITMKTQEVYLKRYCQSHYPNYRCKVLKVNASVYKSIPRQLQEIFNLAQKDDVVAVYCIDRLTRNIVEMMGVIDSLDKRGVKIFALKEAGGQGLYYNKKNRTAFLTPIWNAQAESMKISDRVRNAAEWRKIRGDEAFTVRFGERFQEEPITVKIGNEKIKTYRLKVVVNEEDQKVIQRIRKMSNKGQSASEIAAILNSEGIRKRGRAWNTRMVQQFL